MRRRQFISLLGGAAAAWPLAARAQQRAIPVIGYLNGRSRDGDTPFRAAFHQGLKEVGYVEGTNVAVEYRWGDFQYDRLPALAADLVRRQVAVIFATALQAALPAKSATSAIPIVFAIGSDPVTFGLVSTFNRPGGNITGVSWLGGSTLAAKRLEVLRELVPTAGVIAVLVNPTNPAADAETRELREAARSLGVQLVFLTTTNEHDIDAAFGSLVQYRADALLVTSDAFLLDQRDQLALLAARHAMPVVYFTREFTAAGGLMSYGTSFPNAYRLAGVYTGRILKGDKPADLPVQQSTKVELIINMKAAKAIGITFPITLLGRADEVIE
jgi:putative ABC transport system substrate-binding protein